MALTILPVPYVGQRRTGECLAACAAMVLDYLGAPVAYNRLVKMLEIVPGAGVAAFKIRNLERIGVRVLYESGTLERLREHLLAGQPCIAFIETKELPYRKDDTSHAVVVVGFDNEIFLLHDPEYENSPVIVSAGDFDLA